MLRLTGPTLTEQMLTKPMGIESTLTEPMLTKPALTNGKGGYTLVLDQGSQSSRAIVYSAAGDELHAAQVPVSTRRYFAEHIEHIEHIEQDPAEIVASLKAAITDAVTEIDPALITKAGMATQRSSIVCWNHVTGETLSPIISWQDRRAAGWLTQFQSHSSRVQQLTGLLLSPHYGVSKMRWCLDNLANVQHCHERGQLTIGSLSSYLQYALLAERPLCVDPANASRTLLYDCRQMNWSDELLQLFGIPEAVLPACVPTVYSFGHLRVAGLNVPLSLTTGDQSAALFASGDVDPLTVYVNVGTGAFVQRSSGNQVKAIRGMLCSVVYQDDESTEYVVEGTINGAGSALTYVMHELQFDHQDALVHLPEWLANTASPPLFLNGVSGLGAPWWIPDFPTQFSREGTTAEKVVAVIESIVFLIQVNFEILNPTTDTAKRWVISGGLANLVGVCQRLANLSGLTVVRPDINEGTCRGVWHLLNRRSNTTRPKYASIVFEPQEDHGLFERYSRWRSAMAGLINSHS